MEDSYPPRHRSVSRHGHKPTDGEPPYGSHGDGKCISKLQAENEYMKERVKSCERGLMSLYQLLIPQPEEILPPPRVLTHHRSASLTYRARSDSNSSPSPIQDSHTHRITESTRKDKDIHVVTFPELKEAVQDVLSERDRLVIALEDHRQITEAAKRERVLAIDEKDQLLREAHELKVALDKMGVALKKADSEHHTLANQIRELERDVIVLRRANEEAMRMRSVAMEERSKIIEEFAQLQDELTSLQNERSELLDDTLQLQSAVSKLTNEKRKLLQELDWLSKRSSGYEAVARTLKEQNEVLNGTACDKLSLQLTRSTPGQPWGFSIEGGQGAEFYPGDPSIVVSGVTDKTPADGILMFGDRLLSIGDKDFRNISRKQAAETIRSCDKLILDVEVARVTTHVKPLPREVKIPGKKTFGFTYESRLFVSAVESRSPAAELLSPGDEIIKVMGKPALNMKPSVIKQLLKSCKDGVTMTIQSPPGTVANGNTKLSPKQSTRTSKSQRRSNDSSLRYSGQSQKQTSNEIAPSASYQAPGTPGSTVSETSAGYHSLTHSMPSILSNTLSPTGGPDPRSGQTSLEPVQLDPRAQSQLATYEEEEDEESDPEVQTTTRFRIGSSTSAGFTNGRQRPTNVYTPRRNTANPPGYLSTSGGRTGQIRTRTTSQTSFGGGHGNSSVTSPRGAFTPHSHVPHTPGSDITPSPRFTFKGTSLPRGLNPTDYQSSYRQTRKQVISMSADNLDTDSFTGPLPPSMRSSTRVSRTMSHGGHMARTSSHDMPHGGHMSRTSLHNVSHGSHMTRTSSHDMSHDNRMVPLRKTTPTHTRRPLSMSMGSMQTHV